MKKMMMMLAAVAVFATANAQNAQEEKWYGSKEGGFAITFNANPVLNYVGNMFNGNTNNSLAPFEGLDSDNLFGGTTITGKYFLKDDLALVLGFGFNNKYNVTNNYDNTSDDIELVRSFDRATTTAFQFKGGLEYRLFPGERLQPIFGVDLLYVHTNNWNYTKVTDGDNDGDYTYAGAPTNKLGLMVNVGVEYFIIPQISLGANLDFGVAKTWAWTSRDNKPEGKGAAKNYSRINTKNTALQTGNYGANVSLNFYF